MARPRPLVTLLLLTVASVPITQLAFQPSLPRERTRGSSPRPITRFQRSPLLQPVDTPQAWERLGPRHETDRELPRPALSSVGAWLLDIDGTLLTTDDLYRKVFENLLTPLGHDVTDEFYAANVHGKVDADVFNKLMPAGTAPEELLAMSKKKDDCFVEVYKEEVKEKGAPPLLRGLAEALSMAQQQKIRCIAVTNAPRGAAEACIESLREHIPAASIIEGLVIGAECANAKPHPDPYVEGMRQLGVLPEECLVFEDSPSGAKAGIAAGVRGVVGLRSGLSDEELRAAGCTVTVSDWTEFTPDLMASVWTRALRPELRGA